MDSETLFYIETYGCQMNVADSEVISSIMHQFGYKQTFKLDLSDIIIVNTCSIRENAEQRVRGRLGDFARLKKNNPEIVVAIVGCMAQRLKEELINEEKMVDIVVGPDSYRTLPSVIESARNGMSQVQTVLSADETYADIEPIRYDSNGVSVYVSIMRGCKNMCSYCIVPYVRGDERSRSPESILEEINIIKEKGYKEVCLIGQNVDSYNHEESNYKFSALLNLIAQKFPDIWIRFSTNHPKDLNDDLLHIMAKYNNICKSIHLPVQSGSSSVLERMQRGYNREWYLNRIKAIKSIIPDCSISTDIMVGFCGETENEYEETLSLVKEVEYDFAFMFKYSERPGTYASKHMKDDVNEETKTQRLNKLIELQGKMSEKSKQKDIGKVFNVLIEGVSKKSNQHFFGRNSQNKVVVFPQGSYSKGQIAKVKIISCTSATLIGELI